MGIASFAHPWLLAGLALLAVPIVIHFINRLRFKRIRWAAMDFLLDSQRRNRRRLWMEQLLLLLLRCAAVALVVLVVARPLASGDWASFLGHDQGGEYVVIIDDSYSMDQKSDSATAFTTAQNVVTRLIEELTRQPGNHLLTVLRTSNPNFPDLKAVHADDLLLTRWKALAMEQHPSYLAASPLTALTAVADQLQTGDARDKHLLLISDFQKKDWPSGGPIDQTLARIGAAGRDIQLIDCTTQPAETLGVSAIQPKSTTAAVGIPASFNVAVQNFSSTPRSRVVVTPRVDGRILPARIIDNIPASESAAITFDVEFSSPGWHDIDASIEEDGLSTDNRRYLAIDVPESIPVLIVDGSTDRRDSLYLSLALSPGGSAITGLTPEIRSVDQLKDSDFQRPRVVYLLDVPRLDAEATAALRQFADQGGGLAIFGGKDVDIEWYNTHLFAEKGSLLPAPLVATQRPAPDPEQTTPDLKPENHPIFEVFAGERNSFLDTIAIEELITVEEKNLSEGSRTIARHRDHSPLFMEGTFGRGRVMLVLTTAGDEWTSWPQNPTYVVAMLMLNDYLARPTTLEKPHLVGEPWSLEWDLSQYRREVSLRRPSNDPTNSITQQHQADVSGSRGQITIDDINEPGIYQVTRTRTDGTTETLRRAYNVLTEEGDLTKLDRGELTGRYRDIDLRFSQANDFTSRTNENRSEAKDGLIVLLALVLLGEQLLAYRLSFHHA